MQVWMWELKATMNWSYKNLGDNKLGAHALRGNTRTLQEVAVHFLA